MCLSNNVWLDPQNKMTRVARSGSVTEAMLPLLPVPRLNHRWASACIPNTDEHTCKHSLLHRPAQAETCSTLAGMDIIISLIQFPFLAEQVEGILNGKICIHTIRIPQINSLYIQSVQELALDPWSFLLLEAGNVHSRPPVPLLLLVLSPPRWGVRIALVTGLIHSA